MPDRAVRARQSMSSRILGSDRRNVNEGGRFFGKQASADGPLPSAPPGRPRSRAVVVTGFGLFPLFAAEKLLQCLAMRREKQPVLVAADGVLRLHDVEKARDGDVDAFELEEAGVVSGPLRNEYLHDGGPMESRPP